MTRNEQALRAAQKAAQKAHEDGLKASCATAAMKVGDQVQHAARRAYRDAGGTGTIKVIGHGNTTHPVIWVDVQEVGRWMEYDTGEPFDGAIAGLYPGDSQRQAEKDGGAGVVIAPDGTRIYFED